jgi:hypothetical protein
MSKSKLISKSKKVTFTVKIDENLSERIKHVRASASKSGLSLNMSAMVSKFLLTEVGKLEKELGLAADSHTQQELL